MYWVELKGNIMHFSLCVPFFITVTSATLSRNYPEDIPGKNKTKNSSMRKCKQITEYNVEDKEYQLIS